MDIAIAIITLGALIFSAHFFSYLFRFTKIPNALLLLFFGIIIGPLAGLVAPEDFKDAGKIFTEVTLIFLLFESGVNLKIAELTKSIGSALMLTVYNFLASAIVATLIATIFMPVLSAIFFGVIVAGTSSAVVIPIIKQLKMNQKGGTILLLESTLSDVLCLVIGLALFESMKVGAVDILFILDKIWKSFLFAALLGLAGGLLWSVLLNKVRTLQNSIFTTPAFVFIVYGITQYLGLNGGIATLIFGIALGNAHLFAPKLGKWLPAGELVQEEKNFFSEVVFILSTYFFVYVGISMQFGSPLLFIAGFSIVLLITLARPFSIKYFVRAKMPLKDLTTMSTLAPKGLVPAILAALPLQAGLAGGAEIRDLSYAVVLLSISLGAAIVILIGAGKFNIPFLRNLLMANASDQGSEITEEPESTAPIEQVESLESSPPQVAPSNVDEPPEGTVPPAPPELEEGKNDNNL